LLQIRYPLTNESFKTIQESIDLDSLQLRRQVADIIFNYDLLNESTVCPELLTLINIRVPSYHSRIKNYLSLLFVKKIVVKTHFSLELLN